MKLTLFFPARESALHCISRLLIIPQKPFFFRFISDGRYRIEIDGVPLSALQAMGILDGIEFRLE